LRWDRAAPRKARLANTNSAGVVWHGWSSVLGLLVTSAEYAKIGGAAAGADRHIWDRSPGLSNGHSGARCRTCRSLKNVAASVEIRRRPAVLVGRGKNPTCPLQ
jgi:hypothetical protein